MDLRNLGLLLREERERRGLSLDEISDKIKISKSCLAAIEEGDEERLPHPVYAKGFIRNYARLLGVDNEEFRESLAQIYRQEDVPLQHAALLEDLPEDDEAGASGRATTLRVKRVALAVVLVVLVVAGVWLFQSVFGVPPKTDQPLEPATPEAAPSSAAAPQPVPAPPAQPLPRPQAEAASATPQPSPAPVTVAPQSPSEPPAQPAAPAATAPQPDTQSTGDVASNGPTPEDRATQAIAMSGNDGQQSQTPSDAVPSAPTGKRFTMGEHGPHEVTITAKGRCWIQAGADGGTMRDTLLAPGDSFTGRFSDYLLVRLGNAGDVEIHFDGKLYPFHASKGAVKTLKFLGRKDEKTLVPTASETVAASEKTPAPEKAPAAAASATEKKLEILGTDGSWLILMPDAGPSKEVYIKKGQALTVPFQDKIVIKLGNPSSVVFRYDGKETPVATEKGEARTIRFP